MIMAKRRTFQIGGSRAVTLPGGIMIGEQVSMAANRLLLMDTTGQIPEGKLSEFLTEHLEPAFWRWWESEKPPEPVAQGGEVRVQQAESEVAAQQAMLMESPIRDVICPRCHGNFRWDLSRGDKGFCPYCGVYLWFRL